MFTSASKEDAAKQTERAALARPERLRSEAGSTENDKVKVIITNVVLRRLKYKTTFPQE